jgi:hypothetical protein
VTIPVAGLRDLRTLLAAWEAAAGMPDVARTAALVAHDRSDSVDEVLDLPVAICASQAVAAYLDAFGPHADATCACSSCGEVLQIPLDLRDLEGIDPATDELVSDQVVRIGSRSLTVQALTTRDLLHARDDLDPATALRRTCIRDENGQALPPEALAALGDDDLAVLDAAAEGLAGVAWILMRMRCPACDADITASLDPGALLRERVDAAAPQLLAEVAVLARDFGWSEEAVLALSPARRRAYLDLVSEPEWDGPGA